MKITCKIKTILIDIITLLLYIGIIGLYLFIFINTWINVEAGKSNMFDIIFFLINAGIMLGVAIFVLGIIIIGAIIEYKEYLNNKC